ncbi:hypothetical protein P691DRAFT_785560 [Macrolepiota fuliginosa MF-IS2]|uniref:Uncharacterized protein n=1 Tax=Macrolepiota fuliginosa MF-IS2 TaxID=1400762 RepID=A0A9P6C115_9AGAR|nr:hypothetical protein P691DRAFT_785560 [Macrolepiota fuliginosa MF-IS2]
MTHNSSSADQNAIDDTLEGSQGIDYRAEAPEDDVIKPNRTIPPSIEESLKVASAPLEKVPDRRKEWYLGSGDRQFPPPEIPFEDEDEVNTRGEYGIGFRWPPCDVDISGETPKDTTYDWPSTRMAGCTGSLVTYLQKNTNFVLLDQTDEVLPPGCTKTKECNYTKTVLREAINYGELGDLGYIQKVCPRRKENPGLEEWEGGCFTDSEWREAQKPNFLEFPGVGEFERPEPVYDPVENCDDHGFQLISGVGRQSWNIGDQLIRTQ